MSFFINKVMNKVEAFKDSIQDRVFESITLKYPEIDQLLSLTNLMKQRYNQECISIGIATDIDGDGIIDEDDKERWVPKLLTLGLIYKIQKNDAKKWYNHSNSFLTDKKLQCQLMNTFGYFWHYLTSISKSIRAENKNYTDNTTELLKNTTWLDPNDVIYGNKTDFNHLGDHCPDFALTIDKKTNQLVLTICGTRIIPAPVMKDIFMDLYADSVPFLHGHAHRGMAIGCKNILDMILPEIVKTLKRNPGMDLLILGYSLGAGIGQLVAIECLEGPTKNNIPYNTHIRCICYGAPPIFRSDEIRGYKCPNVFTVAFNNDGLVSASLTNVLKLFMQIRALEQMNMRRRDMMRLLFSKQDVNISIKDEESDDSESEMGDVNDNLESSKWAQVRSTLDKVNHIDDFVHLEHPSKFYIFKRKNDVITRVFRDTMPFSSDLRLRGSMFNDHMPWGYNSLFKGFGENEKCVTISCLDVPD